jgi:hypothetical protein
MKSDKVENFDTKSKRGFGFWVLCFFSSSFLSSMGKKKVEISLESYLENNIKRINYKI